MVITAALLCLAAVLSAPAAAQCRLALAVAMDVSSSVDAAEDELQRGGLVAALRSPDVQSAFLASPQTIALAVYEWSGRYNQKILLDWTMIESAADMNRAAGIVDASTRSSNDFPTAMGYALGFGSGLLARAPGCDAQTLDMAGDGQNNEGFGPGNAYDAFPFEGVTVNGLVVDHPDSGVGSGLVAFYTAEVLRGPLAFLEVASGFDDYARAIRRKLLREATPPIVGQLRAPPGSGG